ncbi:JNK-interacting protein 1 [Cloeon dipterum]|uniref:JNK-interacting protein 1 n=1 Tax=Cloeon dipterum TaxID=197152 RepID=UPI0032207362
MGDTEFEQFRRYFDRLPQYIKAPAHTYTLVHDIALEEAVGGPPPGPIVHDPGPKKAAFSSGSSSSASSTEGDRPQNDQESIINGDEDEEAPWRPMPTAWPTVVHRRRRKLPEIPKNKKNSGLVLSLADELGQVGSGRLPETVQLSLRNGRHAVGAFQLRGSTHFDSSPEGHTQDFDSGHSTTNSPDGTARPISIASSSCCSCSLSEQSLIVGGAEYRDVTRLVATHRGLHKFVPRHRDEIEIEIGDPIYVQRECDDLWCEGVNMRTRRQGSFPSAYAVDLEYREFDPETAAGEEEAPVAERRERFLLDYLGSIECLQPKGNAVLCQAVKRINSNPPSSRPAILEVSDQGIRMLSRDKNKPAAAAAKEDNNKKENNNSSLDYFYSLKNVSFCGFHPRDQRFLGFITKHPQRQRFACHVFRGDESMRPVAETIGRAFERYYQKYIETAYPTEDIYIDDD